MALALSYLLKKKKKIPEDTNLSEYTKCQKIKPAAFNLKCRQPIDIKPNKSLWNMQHTKNGFIN